ncbi:MAG TPA: FAD-dependent oxidoreductase [Caulobacteraceae bacterium]|nr:FAD-dependent oxidoreductase [Caulobacteraceae bacterium]
MADVDFLVCGAGIAGASIAAELAAHARVLIVEMEDSAGYHTTGRSAALYIASYGNAAIRALTLASRPFFDAPPPGFAEHPLLSPRGCLHIAGPDQLDALEALAADLAATGVEARRIDGAAARALVPILKPEAVAAAIDEPDAADIDVGALHAGFLRLAKSRGADLRLSAGITALRREGDAWRAVLADGTDATARVVVDAAGAWGDRVAVLAGARPIGLTPCRRTAMILDPPPGADIARWPAVIDVDEAFYFKPEAGKLLASPADETPSEPTDAAPDELDIAICIDRIQQSADLPVRRVQRSWAGLRTFTPDRTLAIGYDPAAPGLFWYVGQGGYGMQLAPAAARLGAALARREPPPADIDAELRRLGLTAEAYSPGRFAGLPAFPQTT